MGEPASELVIKTNCIKGNWTFNFCGICPKLNAEWKICKDLKQVRFLCTIVNKGQWIRFQFRLKKLDDHLPVYFFPPMQAEVIMFEKMKRKDICRTRSLFLQKKCTRIRSEVKTCTRALTFFTTCGYSGSDSFSMVNCRSKSRYMMRKMDAFFFEGFGNCSI